MRSDSRHRRRRTGPLAALLLAGLATAHAGDSQLLYFEPLQPAAPATGDGVDPGSERLSFDAFGRRFVLQLAPNARLNRHRRGTDFTLLTGAVEGLPGSWVRLMRQDQRLSGLVFDGTQIYAVEPWREVRARSLQPDAEPGTENVIYRLDDLLMPPAALACEVARPGTADATAADAYAALAGEMGSPPALAAQGATRRITLGAVADFEFVQHFQQRGLDPDAELLARVNIVDGLYSEQFALQIELADTTSFPTDSDPFTATAASELLSEVSDYRLANHTTNGTAIYGLTHLLTGRNLDGTTRGIAWLGGACRSLFGAALSAQGADAITGALIMAHEIGHNLNARHDGEVSADPSDPNPCESVPRGFLMWPVVDGSDRFSQCSLDTMATFVASPTASCVTALGAAVEPAPPPPAPSGGGGGGGGGALGLATLAGLGLLAWRRRAPRRSAPGRPR